MTRHIPTSSSKLCEQFGLDIAQRRQRLEFLELEDSDHTLATELSESVITPNVGGIIDQFYAKLVTDPGAFSFISDDETLSRLKKTQIKYLLTLGVGFDTEEYFEDRLRVGLVHDRVGLPLTIYQCSYNVLQKIIIGYIRKMLPGDCADAVIEFLLKIISLDMSLAIEAYHDLQVQGLTRSLDNMKDRQRSLQRRVSTDELTGALSRSQILKDLQRSMQNAKNDRRNLSVIMLDIDFFKRVNDQYGHQTGDQVLTQISKRFKTSIRNVDMVGRYGGEEFLVILPDANMDTSNQIAERIRAHAASSPIKSGEAIINVSVSAGVTMFVDTDSAESLLERADKALYEAKEGGRNRVVYLGVESGSPS